ncbi:hypothetical protein Taro_028193, partial [Colocasia esculenta]|nr:hypothetical protein [Colocasia esculenta]
NPVVYTTGQQNAPPVVYTTGGRSRGPHHPVVYTTGNAYHRWWKKPWAPPSGSIHHQECIPPVVYTTGGRSRGPHHPVLHTTGNAYHRWCTLSVEEAVGPTIRWYTPPGMHTIGGWWCTPPAQLAVGPTRGNPVHHRESIPVVYTTGGPL